MKNLYKIFILLWPTVMFLGCESEELIFKGESLAQFNGDGQGTLTINPSEDVVNVFSVGVTASSSVDRVFVISVDESSSIDTSYYSLASETGVIKAGEYSANIEITMFSTLDFPISGSQLILNLESVEGTEFMLDGDTTLTLGFLVACAFDESESVGTYTITEDFFGASLNSTFEVIAGPESNQLTLLNPLGHTNPETGEEDYEVVVDIDVNTGSASVADYSDSWDPAVFGLSYTDGSCDGDGYVFSCLQNMQFEWRYCVNVGCYSGTYSFKAERQ